MCSQARQLHTTTDRLVPLERPAIVESRSRQEDTTTDQERREEGLSQAPEWLLAERPNKTATSF